jgi:hypothetical protein
MTFREQQATAKAIEQVLLLATAAASRRARPATRRKWAEVQRFLDRHQAWTVQQWKMLLERGRDRTATARLSPPPPARD